MRNLCPLLTVLFLLTAASQNTAVESPFLTIAGKPTYRAEPGENVTLLCMFQTDRSMELHHLTIHWIKDGSTKWLFNGTSNITQGELDNLLKNRANLHLSHVQKEDSGRYSCTIRYRRMEKTQESILTVEETKNHLTRQHFSTHQQSNFELNDISQKATALPSKTHDKYRTLKMGLVVGALVTTFCFSLLIFFFVVV